MNDRYAIGGAPDRLKWKLKDSAINRRNRAEQGLILSAMRGDPSSEEAYMVIINESYCETQLANSEV